MRFPVAAPALAALALAAPAAAQPAADELVRGAAARLAANAPATVRNYSLTLVHGADTLPVYVHRDSANGAWEVETPGGPASAGMLEMAMIWPQLGDPHALDILPRNAHHTRYLREDRVGGRRVHVVSALYGDDPPAEQPDSSLLFVDAETRQVLRLHFSGPMQNDGDGGLIRGGGRIMLEAELGDHRETDGLTVPRQVRLILRMDGLELSAEEREEARAELDDLREQMRTETEPVVRGFLQMVELLARLVVEGRIELPVAVENVRVNTGPPAWPFADDGGDYDEEAGFGELNPGGRVKPAPTPPRRPTARDKAP